MFKKTSIVLLAFMAAAIALAGPPAAPRHERAYLGLKREMSPELVAKVIEVAQDVDPVLAEQLQSLRATGGEAAFQRSIGRARHLVGLARLRDSEPHLYEMKLDELQVDAKLNHTIEELREARRTGSQTVAVLETELKALVRQQVAFSIANRGASLARLKQHIEALEAQINEAGDSFEQTVETRYQELLLDLNP